MMENYFKAKILFLAKLTFKWGGGSEKLTFSDMVRLGSLQNFCLQNY